MDFSPFLCQALAAAAPVRVLGGLTDEKKGHPTTGYREYPYKGWFHTPFF